MTPKAWYMKDDAALLGSREIPVNWLAILEKRQQPAEASGSSYNHKWLLFLIPIVLVFFGLIAAIWIILRRRRKRRQRRSSLRNVTLVVADEEKRIERLSRNNSLSSRISRMASVKSTHSNNRRSTRRPYSASREQMVETGQPSERALESNISSGEAEAQNEQLSNEITSVDHAFDVWRAYDGNAQTANENDGGIDTDRGPDIESAENGMEQSSNAAHRVRVRSGISIIGGPRESDTSSKQASSGRGDGDRRHSTASQARGNLTSALKKDASGVQRQASQRSTNFHRQDEAEIIPARTESNERKLSSVGRDPFSTPSPSNDQDKNLPDGDRPEQAAVETKQSLPSGETSFGGDTTVVSSTPSQDAYRALPVPAKSKRPRPPVRSPSSQAELERSNSRRRNIFALHGRRKSTNDAKNVKAASTIENDIAQGKWTYTSRADEWQSSEGNARPERGGSLSVTAPLRTRGSPSPAMSESGRRTAGVAGSKFVEGFD